MFRCGLQYSSESILVDTGFLLSLESYIMTYGQSASLTLIETPIWGLRLDFYYCQRVADLLMWGALSDERMGLSFVYAAGPCQRSLSWVRVPWDLRPYFSVSDLRLSFLRLLRLAGSWWRYSDPASILC
jgi:hypothetical protein